MANTFPDYSLINKGVIPLGGSNFAPFNELPLDCRQVVPTLEGLEHLIENAAAYAGMIVYVTSEDKHYKVNADKTYRELGLTSKELNEIITNATTAAMEFKGATAALPESGVKGDMYKVSASFEVAAENDAQGLGFTTKIGDSVVYDGEKWYLIPSGDDIEDTWRPVTDVDNDAALTFVDGDKIDAVVAADGTVKFNHEKLEAAPADIATEEDKKTRTYLTAVEVDEYGHVTNYKTATENVEDTDTTYEFECQVEEGHSNVHFTVKASDAEHAQEICLDAYTRNEIDGKLDTKLDAGNFEIDEDGARLLVSDDRGNHAELAATGLDIYSGTDEAHRVFLVAEGLDAYDGDSSTFYSANKIKNDIAYEDEDGQTRINSVELILPTEAGTLARTEDIDAAVEALEDKIDSIDYSSFKTKQDEYSVTGDSKKTVTGVTQNANGEVEVTFGDIDFSHNHDDQYKKLQEAITGAATDTNVFVESVSQNENGEISVATKAVDFTEVNEAIDKKLDANGWVNEDNSLIGGDIDAKYTKLSKDYITVGNSEDYSYTTIKCDSLNLTAYGDTYTNYEVGKITNIWESASENAYNATINLPTKSGTLALTSDVEAAVSTKLDAGNWAIAEGSGLINDNGEEIQLITSDGSNLVLNSEGITLNADTSLKADSYTIYSTSDNRSTSYQKDKVVLTDYENEKTYDLAFPEASGTLAITSDVEAALQAAKDYADGKAHENTTYEFAATENALEFTVTPSEGETQTVTLVAPTVDTGVMEVTAGTDIVVTPGENGSVEVAHKEYQTGKIQAPDATEIPNFINGITIENGHVTGATVQSLADALKSMSFIFDGGSAEA